jgi:2,4-dienoyl-CoA reductase-like NADH-dependent reductase (Old Yellow Enzyme family)
LREPGDQSSFLATDVPPVSPHIRKVFGGTLILNSDYVGSTAEARQAHGDADAISFGRPFIGNPRTSSPGFGKGWRWPTI